MYNIRLQITKALLIMSTPQPIWPFEMTEDEIKANPLKHAANCRDYARYNRDQGFLSTARDLERVALKHENKSQSTLSRCKTGIPAE